RGPCRRRTGDARRRGGASAGGRLAPARRGMTRLERCSPARAASVIPRPAPRALLGSLVERVHDVLSALALRSGLSVPVRAAHLPAGGAIRRGSALRRGVSRAAQSLGHIVGCLAAGGGQGDLAVLARSEGTIGPGAVGAALAPPSGVPRAALG